MGRRSLCGPWPVRATLHPVGSARPRTTILSAQAEVPSAETAAMLFWALLASGQITMRKVDGWQTLAEKPAAVPLDLAA